MRRKSDFLSEDPNRAYQDEWCVNGCVAGGVGVPPIGVLAKYICAGDVKSDELAEIHRRYCRFGNTETFDGGAVLS